MGDNIKSMFVKKGTPLEIIPQTVLLVCCGLVMAMEVFVMCTFMKFITHHPDIIMHDLAPGGTSYKYTQYKAV